MRQIGLLDRIRFAFGRGEGVMYRATKSGPYYMSSPNEYMANLLRGGGSGAYSGVDVDESAALGASPFLASVKVLCETLASLPIILYRRLPNGQGKERATDHPLYKLLHQAVSPDVTAYHFKERMQAQAVLRGDAFAQVIKDANGGYPSELVIMDSRRVTIKKESGRLYYEYRQKEGGSPRRLPSDQIFHVSGFGVDATRGLDPVATQRETLGITLAAQLFGATFFGNSANAGGVIEVDKTLSDAAYKRLKNDWEEKHQGAENAHKVAILEEGSKWHQITVPPDEAQYLETRRFQVAETARPHRVPPHLVGDLDRATFSNIEHQSLEFIIYTMLPWFTRWEQAISLQLIPEWDRDEYFAEFLVDAVVRGDLLSRMNAYRIGREIGLYSANDIRAKENENAIEGGDTYHVPLNWIPVDEAGRAPQPAADPPPEVDDGEDDAGEKPKAADARAIVHERSAAARGKIAEAYRPTLENAFGQVVADQVRDIAAAVKKTLRERDAAGFTDWLDGYFRGQPDAIRERIAPSYGSLMEAIRQEISAELGSDIRVTPQNEAFVRSYVDRFVDSYVRSTRNEIDTIIRGTPTGDDALPDALDKRLSRWSTSRARKYAADQSVRASNALSKMFYAGAGIMYLRWYARGSKSCPLCQKLDGQVVGITESFVSSGETIDAGGKKLRSRRRCAHAPLHQGCTCQIGPG